MAVPMVFQVMNCLFNILLQWLHGDHNNGQYNYTTECTATTLLWDASRLHLPGFLLEHLFLPSAGTQLLLQLFNGNLRQHCAAHNLELLLGCKDAAWRTAAS